jgi:hypothetical protein
MREIRDEQRAQRPEIPESDRQSPATKQSQT